MMPASRLGRIFYVLIVTISLIIITRNLYQRWIDDRLSIAVRTGTVAEVRRLLSCHANPDHAIQFSFEGRRSRKYSMLTLAFYRLIDIESAILHARAILRNSTLHTVPLPPSPEQNARRGFSGGKMLPMIADPAQFGLDIDALEAQRKIAESIVCMLVQQGVRLVPGTNETSYLAHACTTGNLTVIRCLLDQGISVPVMDPRESAMDVALTYPQSMLSGMGRRRGSERSAFGQSSSNDESRRSNPERRKIRADMVRLLREHGAFLTAAQAVALGDAEALRGRLDSTSAADMGQLVPVAAQRGDLKTAEILLDHGASANMFEDPHESALYTAANRGDIAMAELLIKHGALVNAPGLEGHVALNAACQRGDIAMIKVLLAHGGDLNAKGRIVCPLRSAIRGSNPATVRFLLLQGADTNYQDRAGIPLLSTTLEHMPEVVPDMLQHGAQVNPPMTVDRTPWSGSNRLPLSPLMTAIWYAPQYEEMLRKRGANIEPDRHLIMITAANRHRIDLFPHLLKYGVDVNSVDFDGETPLTQSILYSPEGVKTLLQHGANPNVITRAQRAPLQLAAIAGNVEVTRQLLKYGADANHRPSRGHSALYYATRHHHTEIIALLQNAGAKDDTLSGDIWRN